MHANPSARVWQQRRIRKHARDSDAYTFFNLLTGPELLDQVESLLPPHRERLFPPTETLSMFLAQALSADRSCQKAVDDTAIRRVAASLPVCSTAYGGLLSCAKTLASGDGVHAGALHGTMGCRITTRSSTTRAKPERAG